MKPSKKVIDMWEHGSDVIPLGAAEGRMARRRLTVTTKARLLINEKTDTHYSRH